MSKLAYKVEPHMSGSTITVTRLADNAEKVFFIACQPDTARLEKFMSSVTDEQANDYFPKPRKQK